MAGGAAPVLLLLAPPLEVAACAAGVSVTAFFCCRASAHACFTFFWYSLFICVLASGLYMLSTKSSFFRRSASVSVRTLSPSAFAPSPSAFLFL